MSDQAKILVWDKHTRIFHWALVIFFIASMVTGLWGDIDMMEWHIRSGYALLGLLIFRLLTGLLGGDYGHFSRFPLRPTAILAYIRGQKSFIGHNPLGSWMVVIVLLALLAQALSGLLTTDDIFTEGPWVAWADDSWISFGGFIHSNNYRLLLALAGVHIAAVLFYRLRRKQDLITPMLTGYKSVSTTEPAANRLSIVRLLALAAIAAMITWLLIDLSID